ncbi:hypothetical protein [Bacterioplanoides sp.]|uniref:hypothetical protein n=1 Tax=Bacterioplanoides sp. TaxID=2066072 RepID=UPI003B00FA2E
MNRLDQTNGLRRQVTRPGYQPTQVSPQNTRAAQAARGFAQMQDSLNGAISVLGQYGQIVQRRTAEEQRQADKENKRRVDLAAAEYRAGSASAFRTYSSENTEWSLLNDPDHLTQHPAFRDRADEITSRYNGNPELQQQIADRLYQENMALYSKEFDSNYTNTRKRYLSEELEMLSAGGMLDGGKLDELFETYSDLPPEEIQSVLISKSADQSLTGNTTIADWMNGAGVESGRVNAEGARLGSIHSRQGKEYNDARYKEEFVTTAADWRKAAETRVEPWSEDQKQAFDQAFRDNGISRVEYINLLNAPSSNIQKQDKAARDKYVRESWLQNLKTNRQDSQYIDDNSVSTSHREVALQQDAERAVQAGTAASAEDHIAQLTANIGFVHSEHKQRMREAFSYLESASVESFDTARVMDGIDLYRTYQQYSRAHAQRLLDDESAPIMAHIESVWDNRPETLQSAVQQAVKARIDPRTGKTKAYRLEDTTKHFQKTDFYSDDGITQAGIKDLYDTLFSTSIANNMPPSKAAEYAKERTEALTMKIGDVYVPTEALQLPSGGMISPDFVEVMSDSVKSSYGLPEDEWSDYQFMPVDMHGEQWSLIDKETGTPVRTTTLPVLHRQYGLYQQYLRDNTLSVLNQNMQAALRKRANTNVRLPDNSHSSFYPTGN